MQRIAVSLLEVGGEGGVFQHSVAVADALARSGVEVKLLTNAHREVDPEQASVVEVFDWHRSRRLRSLRIVSTFLLRTTFQAVRSNRTVWVQGTFKIWLTAYSLLILRLTGRRLLFSPHNLFARSGRRSQKLGLSVCLRLAPHIIVYNRADLDLLTHAYPRKRVSLLPLLQYTPQLTEADLSPWREMIRAHGIRVAAIGQIRSDKNLPMLMDACAAANLPLLIAGKSVKAAQREVDAAAVGKPVVVIDRYLGLKEIASLASAVGLIALPYSVASQSGAAVLAKAYGATVVARDVGGLSEQADATVATLDPSDWADALVRQRDNRSLSGEPVQPRAVSTTDVETLLAALA